MQLVILLVVCSNALLLRTEGDASQECEDEIWALNSDFGRQIAAASCEARRNLTQKCISAMRKSDYDEALGYALESFRNCANISEPCAAEFAPEVLVSLKMSGAGVCTKCNLQMETFMNDTNKSIAFGKCEEEHGYIDRIIAHVQMDEINPAIALVAEDLHTCSNGNLTEFCSEQLSAPVLQLLIDSLLGQTNNMIPLFHQKGKKTFQDFRLDSNKLQRFNTSLHHFNASVHQHQLYSTNSLVRIALQMVSSTHVNGTL